jgi:hypothetical protein
MTGPRAQDPAEGSRDTIDRELARNATKTSDASPAGAADIERLLGNLEAAQISAILVLDPSLADLKQAAAWVNGDGDRAARVGLLLEGKAAAIFDIAHPDEEADEPY